MDITSLPFLSIGAIPGSYIEFTEYGEIILHGDATAWEDLRVPLTQSKLGVLGKPDFDETNIGYLFPQNNPAEILFLIMQMPHAWKEGSAIYPHVHWRQSANQAAVFKIDYKWINTGGAVPANFTTLTLDQYEFTYTSGNMQQVSYSANGISGTGKTLSSILLVKLYRDDNVYTGDLLAWDFDVHYEIDGLGTKTKDEK